MEFRLEIQKDQVSNAGAFLAVLSTSKVDRQGDRVLPAAFTSHKHAKKPLLIGHDASALPIGTASITDIEADRVLVRGQLLMSSPRAQEAAALMKEGVVSLSWRGRVPREGMANKGGVREINRIDALDEITVTAIPANDDARILAVKGFGTLAVEAFAGDYAPGKGRSVECAVLKAAGDPILSGSTFPGEASRVDSEFSARAGSWLSRLIPVPLSSGVVAAPRLTGFEGDAAAQAGEGAAVAQVNLTFELAETPIPTWAASVPVSKQVLEDSPALAALVFEFLRSRIVRQIEARAASDLVTLAGAADADAFVACGALADLGFVPAAVLMNPKKVWARASAQTNSDAPPRIGGVPVLPSAGLTAAQGLAVSFEALRFLDRESVTLDIGTTNAQFTSNMRTVRGNARALVAISDKRAVRHFTVA